MREFETGKIYQMRSLCMHDCIWRYKVVRRTAKTVTIENLDSHKTRTCRISRFSAYNNVETVHPLGVYSMCPALSADHEASLKVC